MSLRRTVTLVLFLAVFAMAARLSVDTDTWWHLRAGQWILEHRAVPQADPFSYTRLGAAWQYPGWLVEVPMYLLYRWFGPGGLNLWTAVMVTLAFYFIKKAMNGGPFLQAFIIVLAAAVSAVYWAARPYLVTFLLAAVFLWILEDFRWRRANRLWLLPLLMILWANSHGGFAVGFLLWGVYLADALKDMIVDWVTRLKAGGSAAWMPRVPVPARLLLLTGIALLAAVCLNPCGAVMLLYPFKTVSIGALQNYIQEWQSPDFHQVSVQPFAWLMLAILGAAGLSRKRLALTDFLLAGGFFYMGLLAGRNIALFALAAPVVLARLLDPLLAPAGRWLGLRPIQWDFTPVRLRQLNMLLVGVLALAVLAKLALVVPAAVNEIQFRKDLPVGAVEYLQAAHPPGRLFNAYNWGGYLLWALPEYPVFVDGRTDLYNDAILNEWLKVVRVQEGWQAVLDKYDVRLVLIEKDSTLARMLAQSSDWQLAYSDALSIVYRRGQ